MRSDPISVPDPELIDRYLAGRLEPDEVARMTVFFDGHPEWRAAMAALRESSRGYGDGMSPDLSKLMAKIEASIPTTHHRERATSSRALGVAAASVRTRGMSRWAVWGASAAALVLAAVVTLNNLPLFSNDTAPVRTYVTTIGQQASITLADGSRVMLAPQSKLRVSAFNDRVRQVTLEGEAYFDVPNATGAPFVVRTGGVSTRVLGTAFFVRRYAAESQTLVSVRSGKVAVTPMTHHGVTLSAGGTSLVNDSAVTAHPNTQYTEWMDGQLVFHDAPAADVLAALTRWYGYEFRFADSQLKQKKLTVSISTRSSTEALSTLKLYLDVQLAFDGKIVTLTPRRNTATPLRTPHGVSDSLITRTREVGR